MASLLVQVDSPPTSHLFVTCCLGISCQVSHWVVLYVVLETEIKNACTVICKNSSRHVARAIFASFFEIKP